MVVNYAPTLQTDSSFFEKKNYQANMLSNLEHKNSKGVIDQIFLGIPFKDISIFGRLFFKSRVSYLLLIQGSFWIVDYMYLISSSLINSLKSMLNLFSSLHVFLVWSRICSRFASIFYLLFNCQLPFWCLNRCTCTHKRKDQKHVNKWYDI